MDGGRGGPTMDPSRYYRYELEGGWTVVAGRSSRDNDRLSIKIAKANDWWFHVRGMSGSHVILQGREGVKPGKAILEQAAAVAAYHSKARSGGIVPVSMTQAKHVRKPKGAPAGTVEIRKEKVLKVRPGLPEGVSRSGP